MERRDHTEEGRTTQVAAPGTTARDERGTAGPAPLPDPLGTREQSHRGQTVTANSGLHGFAGLPTPFLLLESPSRNIFQVGNKK